MRYFLVFAAFSGMLSVILGAFAAHGLKNKLSESMLATFQTGVQYQLYHSLAILLVVVLYRQTPHPLMQWSASLLSAGIVLFSFSLYLLALTGNKWFGPVTPIGGLCFVTGWFLLLLSALRSGWSS